jgi:hypothetical protein
MGSALAIGPIICGSRRLVDPPVTLRGEEGPHPFSRFFIRPSRLRGAGPVSSGLEAVDEATDVMRVDRLPELPSAGFVRQGAKGAMVGAGAVGVPGLLVGHAPPPRVFLAGSVLGAYQQAQHSSMSAGPGTVYLSESVAPKGNPAAQLTPRSVPR